MHEIQAAMTRISGLPTQGLPEGISELAKAEIRKTEMQNFFSALKGVTAYGLAEAVERIMQGALGHSFMPKPPELRMLIDSIMKPIRDAATRDRRDHQIKQDMKRDSERQYVPPERRRALVQKWETMKAEQDAQRQNEEFETVSELRSRIIGQIGETAFNNIPDLPVRDTFKQVGKAA